MRRTQLSLLLLPSAHLLSLPFLTGTGLFAYKLTEGRSYRETMVYRPYAEREGIARAEKAVTFK